MKKNESLVFNPPPGWPVPPKGWSPSSGWTPDPAWPEPPPGWVLWIPRNEMADIGNQGQPAITTEETTGHTVSKNADQRINFLEAENATLKARLNLTHRVDGVINLDDELIIQEAGVYRYHHPLEDATSYKKKLDLIDEKIASHIKNATAIVASKTFTFDGSISKGRVMSNDLAKLMLRAYNAEAENVVRTLRAGNSNTAIKRLESARSIIAKLGKMMDMHISDDYHALRIQEIELTADYIMKKLAQKEDERNKRELLREERKAQIELAAARQLLEKEREHLLNVSSKMRIDGLVDPDIDQKIAQIDEAIAQNDYRAANIRAGYVYVISNRGAFGDHVVKIGLTRRLEPLDRIVELGDASVPFRFDVHALFFSENAVSLENELHKHFESRRVNYVNYRKEFFFATPAEVREVLSEKLGNLLEFSEHAESIEYLQSTKYWPKHVSIQRV